MTITIRDAQSIDLPGIASGLRRADLLDIRATMDLDPLAALQSSYAVSESAQAICVGGKPCAVFGVATNAADPLQGHPWLLSTPEMFQGSNAIWFARAAPPWLERWLEQYTVLTNVVGLRNQAHVRWLEWVGFHFTRLFAGDYPLLEFVMHRKEESCAPLR